MTTSGFVFRGSTAVITGAASGLGRAFAQRAGELGMRVMLADIDADALRVTASALKDAGVQVDTCVVDVSHADHVDALADQTFARFGVPQLVFNNAGVIGGGLIWETPDTEWKRVMGVNLGGVVAGVRAFVPAMIEVGRRQVGWRGHVVNVASMAGLVTPPNMGVYNVSKHAVVALTETLYHDLALVKAPIGASVLCPFFVPTAIAGAADPSLSASQRAAQLLTAKAVAGGKISARDVALMTFEGVAEGRFYLYSHPKALGQYAARAGAIVAGGLPADPYAGRPEFAEQLRSLLDEAD
ncbi:SDR family NAD(P)-dependent oxidoreductase [Pigmentiphaga aceris]|uniref:SDR family NAD(P)-dependent oxidoreductase n=1 Tax=Pigmentiphaga aceris TaxID=1940612 RepID=A0A5C0AWH7_9BURK|nr:SDR family NAD(P)-dependent oxidoreductase [Pigmentiphaga aceris]QEI06812.1 SDR family NAD(P)-dependent oxidoreductase [Pigmentiphaga aceris]